MVHCSINLKVYPLRRLKCKFFKVNLVKGTVLLMRGQRGPFLMQMFIFMEAVLKEILEEVLCITRVALNLQQPENIY